MSKTGRRQWERLNALRDEPRRQAALALELLQSGASRELEEAAIRVLAENPSPEARPTLLRRIDHYAGQGELWDPGAQIRSLLIRALRPVAKGEDLAVLERAVQTYEFPPPAFKEEAVPLRAAALIAINDLDELLARYHATRLLADKHTDTMSAEPALTAVRVLSSQQELLPLYYYVMSATEITLPELTSECLGHLTALPESLVGDLIGRYGQVQNELILAGLFDLLLRHDRGTQGRGYLLDFLASTRLLDAYRYLVSVIVADSKDDLLPELLELAEHEEDEGKITILLQAFDVLAYDSRIASVADNLKQRL